MSGNGFDPASFGAGFGGGQSRGRADGDHQASLARIDTRKANEALAEANEALTEANSEIKNRWIPYAVTLGASLVARKVEREDLIAALKKLDPANADQIAKDADQHRIDEYATLKGEKLKPIIDEAYKESEEERRDR